VAVIDTPAGTRTVACADDPEFFTALGTADFTGRRVDIRPQDRQFRLSPP
jgi:hypothetical protein